MKTKRKPTYWKCNCPVVQNPTVIKCFDCHATPETTNGRLTPQQLFLLKNNASSFNALPKGAKIIDSVEFVKLLASHAHIHNDKRSVPYKITKTGGLGHIIFRVEFFDPANGVIMEDTKSKPGRLPILMKFSICSHPADKVTPLLGPISTNYYCSRCGTIVHSPNP